MPCAMASRVRANGEHAVIDLSAHGGVTNFPEDVDVADLGAENFRRISRRTLLLKYSCTGHIPHSEHRILLEPGLKRGGNLVNQFHASVDV